MHFQGLKILFAALIIGLMASCHTNSTRVDFTIDMTQNPYTSLSNIGEYAYATSPNNVGIIVVHDYYGKYYALSEYCTYDLTLLQYTATPSVLFCPSDQSHFNTDGSVSMGPAHTALQTYNTQVNGNYIRIYSN